MQRIASVLTIALIASFAALAAPIGSASAATGWHFGTLVETSINDCYTSDVVNGVGAYAGAQYDADKPPNTGDVFYVNVVLNGIDASCAELSFPEIQLPSGVSTAISANDPIQCFTVDNSAGTETPDTIDCPQTLGVPLLGGTGSIRDVNGPPPGAWDTRAPNAWEFRIPLTSATGGLKAITFPTQVISGSITQMVYPSVSLPITAVTTPPPPPATVTRPFNVLKPRVTRAGKMLTCTAGTWSNHPNRYQYRWTVNGKTKHGADSRTLKVTSLLRHHKVQCGVTASNTAGRATAFSAPFSVR